ncbi:MAG: hypothetical protein JRG91_20165, partial [Deltaproteobacteria bacterium]|nr:hypothetical protein [Deltaproteobacteria bacterium]
MRTRLPLLAITAFLVPAPAMADILAVPGDYGTIAEALAAAVSGDEVEVAAGIYSIDAQLVMPANVTLRGAGAAVTILEAAGTFTLIFPGESSGFTIEGFTLIPHAERSAISCYAGSGVIDANVFLGPGNGTTCGGTITNNVFAGSGE